jgi:hypothetical protein
MPARSEPSFLVREPISREVLYERVWTTPIQHLASEYGVSGSYLARVCTALNVPRPPVGYWQKKAVGKEKPRPPLPAAEPGDQLTWSSGVPLALPRVPPRPVLKRRAHNADGHREALHPLLRGTEALFRKTRKIEDYEYLRPYKELLPDIVTAEACLERALGYADALYNALGRKGHRVMLAAPDQGLRRVAIEPREVLTKDSKYGRYGSGKIWSPYRPTVTFMHGIPIGLTLIEMTERVTLRYFKGKYLREDSDAVRKARSWQLANSWTHQQDVPSGRFRVVAYSPYPGVSWQRSWQETPQQTLPGMIEDMLRALASSTDEVSRLQMAADEAAERARREREAQRARWERAEDRRRTAEAREASQKQLSQIIAQWSSVVAVEQFFREAEARIAQASPDRQGPLSERLALARAMMGTVDPLDALASWVAPEERYNTIYPEE